MSARPRQQRRSFVTRAIGATLGVITIVCALVMLPSIHGAGEIRHHGQILKIPVPRPSIKVASSEDQVSYVTFGQPDFVDVYASHGARFGWKFMGQDGGHISLFSTPDEKLVLGAVIEVRTRFFTQLNFRVDDLPEKEERERESTRPAW